MYSIKPGRGPSIMGGIVSIVAAVFAVFWTIGALAMGAPVVFALFGVVFAVVAVAGSAYNFYNATQKNRMSTIDITTDSEESDPIAQAMGHASHTSSEDQHTHDKPRKFEGDFCPYCGAQVRADFDYCPKCGKDI